MDVIFANIIFKNYQLNEKYLLPLQINFTRFSFNIK